ncbi:MAG: hypothetical protein ACREPE_14390, partial [Lysobacter sp.]
STMSQQQDHRSMLIHPGMRAQINGYAIPAVIVSATERGQPSRRVQVRFDGTPDSSEALVDLDANDVLATWSDPAFENAPPSQTYDKLHLMTCDESMRARQCGYSYVVTSAATAHTAFHKQHQLVSWLAERGLTLTAELPEHGVSSEQSIAGRYCTAAFPSTIQFDRLEGVRTRTMDNSHWTAATITKDKGGIHTINSVNVNCRARQEFDGPTWPKPGGALFFYIPGQLTAVDQIIVHDDGTPLGGFNEVSALARHAGATLEQLRARHPEGLLCSGAELSSQSDALAVLPPIEIDEERYQDSLDVLPPQDWVRRGGSESFKLCEYYSGNVTSIFARIGDRYFELRDSASMSHEKIVASIEASGLLTDDVPAPMAP